MTVDLATQLASILRTDADLGATLGPVAAAPLDEAGAARIRAIVAGASPAVRLALDRRALVSSPAAARTGREAENCRATRCAVRHIGLGSSSRMVDRGIERWSREHGGVQA